MKKLEVYLTDSEYENLVADIDKFKQVVIEHQNDGIYSDEDRASIINSCGTIQFCVLQGLKKQSKEMNEYIKKYEDTIKNKDVVSKNSPMANKTDNNILIPTKKEKTDHVKFEAKTEEAQDFDLM